MDEGSIIDELRAKAVKCRALADGSSDPEVAETLRQMASDIEAAIPILEAGIRKRGGLD
jgi:hypothetical protein